MKIMGRELGIALCEALGVPTKGVRKITIEADCSEAAVIMIERLMFSDELPKVREVMEKHGLAPAEPTEHTALDSEFARYG